ncbi:MAG: histidine--tRNA ligase [Candidatus Paceibacterota bacterium]
MVKMAKKLSKEPYKGVRDFYPEDMFALNYITDVMRESAERFGYVEYSASLLEPTELYESKTSEEIVNEQTYTFTDRGNRSVTLRPEMTPTVARMVAARRRELSFPLRWYSIPNIFRYERPQKGRLREHWQLNCDLFGVSTIEADVEIISLANEIMKSFGAKDEDFVIKINSRNALADLAKKANISSEKQNELFRLIDRVEKMKPEEFKQELENLTGKNAEAVKRYMEGEEVPEDVASILQALAGRGIKNAIFTPSIARGFDYYTGIVFEVSDTNPENNRSLFGGGRYDNLLENFDEESIPAVGFGMGDVTIKEFLESRNLIPTYISSTDLYICVLSDEAKQEAQEIAGVLRSEGFNVALNITEKKVGEQIKKASKDKIPFTLCIGDDEIKSRKFTLKNLINEEETQTSKEGIADVLKGSSS